MSGSTGKPSNDDDALSAFVGAGTVRTTAAGLQKLSEEHLNAMPTLKPGSCDQCRPPVAPLGGIMDA